MQILLNLYFIEIFHTLGEIHNKLIDVNEPVVFETIFDKIYDIIIVKFCD